MKKTMAIAGLLLVCISCLTTTRQETSTKNHLRAPAYPLLSVHPDVCLWSMEDTLFRQHLKFSDGRRDFPLVGAIRVDGKTYRFMGLQEVPLQTLGPVSYEKVWEGKYTFAPPAPGWERIEFDDSGWKKGLAAFGTREQRDTRTVWPSSNIWVRREIILDKELSDNDSLFLRYSHDDVFQLYINGKQLVSTGFEWRNDVQVYIPDSIAETMKSGKVVIAAHCENRFGGSLVDFGLYAKSKKQTLGEEAIQESVDVQATQTNYLFKCGDIRLNLTFTVPRLIDDIESISCPINYISYEVRSLDSQDHEMEIYFELAPGRAFGGDEVSCYEEDNLWVIKSGYSEQKLWKHDEKVNPSWGHFYLGMEKEDMTYAIGANVVDIRKRFAESGHLSSGKNTESEKCYVAVSYKLGKAEQASGKFMFGFDGDYAIQYFGENLLPNWKKEGNYCMEEILVNACNNYNRVMDKCLDFNGQFMENMYQVGGKEYAELCALAYRQALAPFQLAESPEGKWMYFTKMVGSVDTYFYTSPLFLYYNPDVVKAMLEPFFDYSESGKWVKPYPAHDMGGYPFVNGQTYEEDMPVEEAGNILILVAAITRLQGHTGYATGHWEALSRWADFLMESKDQSVKAILGIASYGYLAEMEGKPGVALNYSKEARKRAAGWRTTSVYHPKEHYEQVWDQLLELDLFPVSNAEKKKRLQESENWMAGTQEEINYSHLNMYMGIAAGENDRILFNKRILPVHRILSKTSFRFPMLNRLPIKKGKEEYWEEYEEKYVAGGFFMKMLK